MKVILTDLKSVPTLKGSTDSIELEVAKGYEDKYFEGIVKLIADIAKVKP